MKNYTIFGAMMETKKNKVGRPPKFKTAEELQAAIDDYFEKGVTVKEVIVDKKVVKVKVPTITGLALYIGFCDRHSFYAYEEIGEFSNTIKKARARIEQHYEELLQTGNTVGAIFALKNFGWRDKQEVEMNTNNNGLTVNFVNKSKDVK